MHLHTTARPAIARVVSSDLCTKSVKASSVVRHIAFDISGTDLSGRIIPGQSFGVIPPGSDEQGRTHKPRLYSLASPSVGEDGEGQIIATTVKRTVGETPGTHSLFLGLASNYLCDLQIGDEVQLCGPSGKRFVLPERPSQHDYLFIATGTGIAPFRGMMLDLARRAPESRVVIVAGSPYQTDLLYHEQLAELVGNNAHWQYLTALSREPQIDHFKAMYVHDRLLACADSIEPLLSDDRTLIYICGIAGMELGVLKAITQIVDIRASERFVRIDPELTSSDAPWIRRMIHRQIKPTRRVFMEVYA